mgnify:CR=1 FL=1
MALKQASSGVFFNAAQLCSTGPRILVQDIIHDEFAAKLKEITDQQQAHYEATLKIARERTPDYLVQVATTEPDVAETTIFFLSLIPDQLRPQVTKRWRQLIARRAFADDPVFGPWHDLMREPTLVADCVAAMRAAVSTLVTVKCRMNFGIIQKRIR